MSESSSNDEAKIANGDQNGPEASANSSPGADAHTNLFSQINQPAQNSQDGSEPTTSSRSSRRTSSTQAAPTVPIRPTRQTRRSHQTRSNSSAEPETTTDDQTQINSKTPQQASSSPESSTPDAPESSPSKDNSAAPPEFSDLAKFPEPSHIPSEIPSESAPENGTPSTSSSQSRSPAPADTGTSLPPAEQGASSPTAPLRIPKLSGVTMPPLPSINGLPPSTTNLAIPKLSPGHQASPSNDTPAPEAPPKRKVGRPPGSGKKKKQAAAAARTIKSERLAKLNRSYNEEEAFSSPPPDFPPPKKRGPGRPRKNERIIRDPSRFVEPPLAGPTAMYTGLPLESGPTAKIKKESLWPSKYTRRPIKGTGLYSREGSSVGDDTTEHEETLNRQLVSHLSEDLTKESLERTPLSQKRTLEDRPKTPEPEEPKDESSGRASKRIKVISPRKSITNLAPSTASASKVSYNDSAPRSNEEFCSACGGSGIFICCESCPRSFHFTCCDPPLEDAPEGEWYCRECNIERNPQLATQWSNIGIFSELMNQQETRNPVEFHLPKFLREKTFIGVETGESGDYHDNSMKPDLPLKPKDGQIGGYNRDESLEVDALYDKDGNPHLCHKCGLSGLNHKTLTHCDYCPLVWHIDCLDEPMFGPKTIGSKWRCPNHVENVVDSFIAQKALKELESLSDRFKIRNFKDAKVIEPALRSHFLKISSLSNIVIQYDDQPNLLKNPNLQEYMKYEKEDFVRPKYEYFDKNKSIYKEFGDTLDEEDLHPQYSVPDFFQRSEATNFGVNARPSNHLSKILCLTSREESGQSFVYRVPEKSIMLDFISKAKQGNKIKQQALKNIEEYDLKSRIETNKEERTVVEGLSELKNDRTNFDELIRVAMDTKKKEEGADKVKKEVNVDSITMNEEELEELRKIKKLLELKGKDEMLKFLGS